jgi:hypothetical protein
MVSKPAALAEYHNNCPIRVKWPTGTLPQATSMQGQSAARDKARWLGGSNPPGTFAITWPRPVNDEPGARAPRTTAARTPLPLPPDPGNAFDAKLLPDVVVSEVVPSGIVHRLQLWRLELLLLAIQIAQ